MWKLALLVVLAVAALAEEPAKSSEESAEQYRELEIDDLIKNLEVRLNAQKEGRDKKDDDKDKYEVITIGPMAEEEAQGFPRCPRQKAYRDPRNRAAYKAYEAARSRPKKRIYYDPAEVDQLRREAYGLCNDQALTGNHLNDFERQEQCYHTLMRLKDVYSVEEQLPSRTHYQYSPAKPTQSYDKSQGLDINRQLADRLAESAMQLARKRVEVYPCTCPKCTAEADVATPLSIPIPTEAPPPSYTPEAPKRDVSSSDSAVESLAKVAETAAAAADKTYALSKQTVETDAAAAAKKTGEVVSSKYFGDQFELMTCEEFERKMIMDTAIEQAAAMIRQLAMKTQNEYTWRSDPDSERKVLETAVELVNKLALGIAGGDNQGLLDEFKYKDADDYLRSANVDIEEYEAMPLSNAGFDYVHPAAARADGRKLYDGLDGYGDYVSPYARTNCESCSRYDLRMSGMCPLCKRGSKEEDRAKLYHLERSAEKTKYRAVWEDFNKLYNFEDFENNKFIDLSLNCTEIPTDSNCQRLNFKLRVPEGADPVTLQFVKDNLIQGRELADDMRSRAHALQNEHEGVRPADHSSSMLQYIDSRAMTGASIRLHEESQVIMFGTKVLQEKLTTEYNLKPDKFHEFVSHHGFRLTGGEICRDRRNKCNGLAQFRTIDGSCNNFRNPSWGQSNTAFNRIVPSRYSDNIYAMPVSVSGSPLPNPRLVSRTLFSRNNETDPHYTLALMQWGQMLAYDIGRQLDDQTADGGVECCDPNGQGPLPGSKQHHSCAPILIPTDDEAYTSRGQTCMNFVRSMTVARTDCALHTASQLNGATSYLDLSPVYGSHKPTSDSLREFVAGRLRVEMRGPRVMMPAYTRSGFCDINTNWDACFQTGDTRTNQNPQLAVLHTLFVREHNRIAYELGSMNPHWNDERLFQESRRIVIAEYQYITYRHWLPLVLGEKYCKDNNIVPEKDELLYEYDEKVNPSAMNSFSAGAFRFLHSMVEGTILMYGKDYLPWASLRLSDHYYKPQILDVDNSFESLLRGLIYQPVQKSDSKFHEEITEFLFRSKSAFGLDLTTIDIQRGRDHGLRGYNEFREVCLIGRINGFYDLVNEIPLKKIDKLIKVYEHVDDIDLFAGAAMESKPPGSLVGPTLQCLIGEQFYRARIGDKYFYDNDNLPHSFTPEQFKEIQKSSLANLICDLGDSVTEVQRSPFKAISEKNPLVSCLALPKINLEHWREIPK